MNKTKLEKDYHDFIAQMPCIACGDWPVHVHHIRNFNGTNAGMGKRNSHYLVLPLCPDCHQGENSIHHNRKIFEMRNGTETALLEMVIASLWKQHNERT